MYTSYIYIYIRCMYICVYIYIYREREREREIILTAPERGPFGGVPVRPFFILRIVRPRIFESKFRNYRAKKLDGALRKSISSV